MEKLFAAPFMLVYDNRSRYNAQHREGGGTNGD
jgi:hypothetical protein